MGKGGSPNPMVRPDIERHKDFCAASPCVLQVRAVCMWRRGVWCKFLIFLTLRGKIRKWCFEAQCRPCAGTRPQLQQVLLRSRVGQQNVLTFSRAEKESFCSMSSLPTPVLRMLMCLTLWRLCHGGTMISKLLR